MRFRLKNTLPLVALALTATFLLRPESSNLGYGAASAQSSNVATGLNDQEAVSITVYNSNLGLVKDVRRLTLPTGVTELKFGEVAAKIMPQTVHIKSLTDPTRLQVLEQNYEYDLLTPQKLLEKFVGKEITILKDGVEVPITILSTNQGVVYKLGGRIFTGQPHNLIFPNIPNNLISQPTLVWLLENRSAAPQQIEATYLTQGITWKADYVAVLDSKDKNMDLNGWVPLDNQSGATYQNARLKLVAGDVNGVIEQRGAADAVRALAEVSAKATPLLLAKSRSSSTTFIACSGRQPSRINRPNKWLYYRRTTCRSSNDTFITARSNTCDSDMAFLFRLKRSAPTLRSPTKKTIDWACLYRRASCGSTKPMPTAACSSSAKTGSITRRRMKRSRSRWAMLSIS